MFTLLQLCSSIYRKRLIFHFGFKPCCWSSIIRFKTNNSLLVSLSGALPRGIISVRVRNQESSNFGDTENKTKESKNSVLIQHTSCPLLIVIVLFITKNHTVHRFNVCTRNIIQIENHEYIYIKYQIKFGFYSSLQSTLYRVDCYKALFYKLRWSCHNLFALWKKF